MLILCALYHGCDDGIQQRHLYVLPGVRTYQRISNPVLVLENIKVSDPDVMVLCTHTWSDIYIQSEFAQGLTEFECNVLYHYLKCIIALWTFDLSVSFIF